MEISINKAEKSVEVDYEAFSPDVKSYVIRYGLTQILNDAHSVVKSTDENASAKAWNLAIKKLDALKRGEMRSQTRIGDPIKREAMRLAMIAVAGTKAHKEKSTKTQRAIAEGFLPSFMERAKENVALLEATMGQMALESEEIAE